MTTNQSSSLTPNITTISPETSPAFEELFHLTWNDILYNGGPATWTTRSSIRWLTISVCVIGFLGYLTGELLNVPFIENEICLKF